MERRTKEEEEYFNKLYLETYGFLYRYAARICIEHSDTEDVLQETFKEAYVHLDDVRKSLNPEGYLVKVLKYKVLKFYQKKKKHLERETKIEESSLEDKEKTEEKIVVWDFCKRTLNVMEYNIILRRFRDKASVMEISDELGITEGACKMRMKRSLTKLKKAYEKEQDKNR